MKNNAIFGFLSLALIAGSLMSCTSEQTSQHLSNVSQKTPSHTGISEASPDGDNKFSSLGVDPNEDTQTTNRIWQSNTPEHITGWIGKEEVELLDVLIEGNNSWVLIRDLDTGAQQWMDGKSVSVEPYTAEKLMRKNKHVNQDDSNNSWFVRGNDYSGNYSVGGDDSGCIYTPDWSNC